jgi:hypothetical protein
LTRSGAIATLALVLAAVGLVGAVGSASAEPGAEPAWRLEQPPAPSGSPYEVPLGAPGDLEFIAPNRGLLAVAGNATVSPGLFTYDGEGWHQLSTVCGPAGGGRARDTRIAVAGPREFWTVTVPSQPRVGEGTSLCHFKDGAVIASYSTAPEDPDPYREMDAAACNGPSDCWFGGFGAQDPTGERRGAFHLHWNGTSLETVYAPQGRGVTDVEARGGTFFETVVVGRAPSDVSTPPDLAQPEAEPRLIHRITDGVFTNDPFLPPALPAVPAAGSELLALGTDGQTLWASGGGAASGPSAPANSAVARPPLLLRLIDDAWQTVPVPASEFGPIDRFVDVAPVPGADAQASASAWVAVEPYRSGGVPPGAQATVAHVAADGSVTKTTLPTSGPGRGTAAKIAFTAPNDGWMVTSEGWVFHYSDGTQPVPDGDPAYAGTITFRPNEATEQFVPDAPPVDDSELFKQPPVAVETEPPPGVEKKLPALLRRVRTKLRGHTLEVRFTLMRTARVALTAKRKGKVVARTRPKTMKPGRHVLRLKLSTRKWPQRLSFSVHEPGAGGGSGDSTGGGSGDTVTTGGDTVATRHG